MLNLMLCCRHLKILTSFWKGIVHFYFALAHMTYIVSPACKAYYLSSLKRFQETLGILTFSAQRKMNVSLMNADSFQKLQHDLVWLPLYLLFASSENPEGS